MKVKNGTLKAGDTQVMLWKPSRSVVWVMS